MTVLLDIQEQDFLISSVLLALPEFFENEAINAYW